MVTTFDRHIRITFRLDQHRGSNPSQCAIVINLRSARFQTLSTKTMLQSSARALMGLASTGPVAALACGPCWRLLGITQHLRRSYASGPSSSEELAEFRHNVQASALMLLCARDQQLSASVVSCSSHSLNCLQRTYVVSYPKTFLHA